MAAFLTIERDEACLITALLTIRCVLAALWWINGVESAVCYGDGKTNRTDEFAILIRSVPRAASTARDSLTRAPSLKEADFNQCGSWHCPTGVPLSPVSHPHKMSATPAAEVRTPPSTIPRKRPPPDVDLNNIIEGGRATKRQRGSDSYAEGDEDGAFKPDNLKEYGMKLLNAVKGYKESE